MAASSNNCVAKFLNAALDGNLSLLKRIGKLVDNGEGLKKTFERMKDSDGKTVLHYAALGGSFGVCEYLIENLKLDVNIQNELGETPLHEATRGNNLETAIYLLKQGADIKLADNRGLTALHCAAENGHKEFIGMLISSGAEVDAQSFSGTPLNWAAAKGEKEAVKFLLDNNADPNLDSNHRFTPLLSSIVANSSECMELLLKAGADPNLMSFGVTPLYMAISHGHNESAKYLLKVGADPNIPNSYGLTPLEIGAVSGNHEGVMILFPVTTCIPSIPEWSPAGVVKHVNSAPAKDQRELKQKESFLIAKSNGKDAFQRNDYVDAILWYTEAIFINPLHAKVLSNRSMCWARLNDGKRALLDANLCIGLNDNWPKAYYRAGVAYKLQKKYSAAVSSFNIALGLDPKNEELQKALREAKAAAAAAAAASEFEINYMRNSCK